MPSTTIPPRLALHIACTGHPRSQMCPQRLLSYSSQVCFFARCKFFISNSITGNPGLLDFYIPFLNALHDKDVTENLAIVAHTHIDHTPGVYKDTNPHSRHSLTSQVHSAIEAFDATVAEFRSSKIVVIGHSVGAWVTLQVDSSAISVHS